MLEGDNGKDVFVLTATGNGTDTVVDFTARVDVIGLSGGLTFAQLTLVSVSGGVAIRVGPTTLALLTGVTASQLRPSDFVAV